MDDAEPHRTFFKSDLTSRVDDAVQRERDVAAQWRAVCRVVDARDKRICRACERRSDPEAIGLTKRGHRHHILYRSAGGEDVSSNICTLCFQCHDDEHVKCTLQIEGDANDALTFLRKDADGLWFIWRRELSVGIFEKD